MPFLLTLALAQDLADPPLKLLAGRLTARFPAGAVVEEASLSGITAPAADELETRVVWTSGERTITATAHEQLETASVDFQKDVGAVVKAWVPSLEEVFDVVTVVLNKEAKLRACRVTPKVPALDREEIFVLGLFTAQADGTVQFIKIYANAEAARDFPACAALARRISESVAAGGRKLTLSAGRRSLLEVDGRRVTVDMPDGFAGTFRKGRDFGIGSLTRIGSLGSTAPEIGVYVGRRPGHIHAREDPPVSVVEEAGDVLGNTVQWQRWTRKADVGEEHFIEVILPLPDSREQLLHIFASAPTVDGLQALRGAVATLKVELAK